MTLSATTATMVLLGGCGKEPVAEPMTVRTQDSASPEHVASPEGVTQPKASPNPEGTDKTEFFPLPNEDTGSSLQPEHDGLRGESTEPLDESSEPLDVLIRSEGSPGQPAIYPIPEDVIDPPWLESRRQAQLATVDELEVFCDFQFVDHIKDSGITFRNRIVEDVGKYYVAVHYDHGNGVAIADVDGDDLYDIYFTTQHGSNELWRNLGQAKFENITQLAGVAVADRISVTASFADIDNDGDPDLYVTTVRDGNLLFENDGAGHFVDVSQASQLDYRAHSSGATFFDFDRDGQLDVFLTNVGIYTTSEKRPGGDYKALPDAFAGHLKDRGEANVLFRNMGDNRFADVSEKMQPVDGSWSGDASPLDANGDGWPDLYILNMQGHDQYYENVQGERFVKKSRELFPQTPWGSMGIKVLDYDNDSNMDIFVTDMHSDMFKEIGPDEEELKSTYQYPNSFTQANGQSIWGNAFYRNDGAGQFEEISDQLGAENYWPWGVSAGDLNADGFLDLFVTASMNYPWRYGVNTVLLNNKGKNFHHSEFILGVEPRRQTAAPWFELDCSVADKDVHPMCDGRTGHFIVWGALGSRSSVVFDLDEDGDLDVVTNDFNSQPLVLISNLSNCKEIHFLKVKLRGTTSNRSGLGAAVTVSTDAQSYTQIHDGKSGYLSQSLCPLYFGLGDADSVDTIKVVWPSGIQQTLDGPQGINTTIEIVEEDDQPDA